MHGNLHSNGLFLGFSMDQQRRLHLVIMTDLSKLGHFSTAIFSQTKSVTPIFFSIFGVSTLSTNSREEMKKISPQEDFGANVLKTQMRKRSSCWSIHILMIETPIIRLKIIHLETSIVSLETGRIQVGSNNFQQGKQKV